MCPNWRTYLDAVRTRDRAYARYPVEGLEDRQESGDDIGS